MILLQGKKKEIKSFLLDEKCEEWAFPSFVPSGKLEHSWKCQTKLSGSKYINQRSLN